MADRPTSQGAATVQGIQNSRLARLLAGVLPQEPPQVTSANFSSPFPPYTGLRNEPAPPLPAFEPPGTASAAVMPDRGLTPTTPPVTVTAQRPQPAPAPAPQPPMPAPVAEVPPMPPPQQIGVPQVAGFDPNDPRYLPEQWRGSFNLRS